MAGRAAPARGAPVTRIGWGATRQSTNGVTTSTTYGIFFGDAQTVVTIRLHREQVFSEVVNRLFTLVGARLYNELRRGLGQGERYEFGDAVLDDIGLTLTKHHWFRANERVFASWEKLRMWSANGSLFIAMKEDPKAYLALPYQAANNAHVLEMAVNAAFKSGLAALSLTLE